MIGCNSFSLRVFSNVFYFAKKIEKVVKRFSGKNYNIFSVADVVRCNIILKYTVVGVPWLPAAKKFRRALEEYS